MPAPTLDGRLLCASGAAYFITQDGTLAAPAGDDVYYPGAGFVAPPTTFVGGADLIDACLVGTSPDGVVVAFRGTMPLDLGRPPTVLDWLDDFDADPITVAGLPGQVHQGFSQSFASLWDRAFAEVRRQRTKALAQRPVLVTGHSKGGAMAALAAWKLQSGSKIPVKVATFAAPRTGDVAFATVYNAAITHTRYEYADDIVPHLPPEQGGFLDALQALPVIGARFAGLERFNYQPVGTLNYIDSSGRFVATTPMLPLERTLDLTMTIVRLHFHKIAADHSIACGSGYMTAVCPTGVCLQSIASVAFDPRIARPARRGRRRPGRPTTGS
jgi:hypothetical protein